MFKGKARAYTNIALIKYWGKKNEALILPMNNSLSLTLDAFYTETEVIFSDSYIADEFYLDDTLQDEKATKKVSQFLDLFPIRRNHQKYFGKLNQTRVEQILKEKDRLIQA